MLFHLEVTPDSVWFALIGGLYFLTNATRVFTYIPQVVVVWRCKEGARSVSLLTWGFWVLSNCTATAYGVLVLGDGLFVAISVVNLIGCGMVAAVAARRRSQWRSHGAASDAPKPRPE